MATQTTLRVRCRSAYEWCKPKSLADFIQIATPILGAAGIVQFILWEKAGMPTSIVIVVTLAVFVCLLVGIKALRDLAYPSTASEDVRKLAEGIADATKSFQPRAPEDPPFVMRLVGGWDHVRVDREVEGGGYDVIKFELENARPIYVAGIEVFISGVSHHLNSLRKHTAKIPKLYLTSRRQVDYLNSSGKEEYVLLSREIHDRPDEGIRTFWGDYRFTPDEKRLDAYAHEDAVHIVEITVTSPTTPLFTCSLRVIVTSKREQILPIDPKGNGWARSV